MCRCVVQYSHVYPNTTILSTHGVRVSTIQVCLRKVCCVAVSDGLPLFGNPRKGISYFFSAQNGQKGFLPDHN